MVLALFGPWLYDVCYLQTGLRMINLPFCRQRRDGAELLEPLVIAPRAAPSVSAVVAPTHTPSAALLWFVPVLESVRGFAKLASDGGSPAVLMAHAHSQFDAGMPHIARILIEYSRTVDPRTVEEIKSVDQKALLIRRFHLIRDRDVGNVFLHRFFGSDEDRALHDHPWTSISLILQGRYLEHMPGGKSVIRSAGDILIRAGEDAHRIELVDDPVTHPTWTLFSTAGKSREWGFHCRDGWMPWQQHVLAGCGDS